MPMGPQRLSFAVEWPLTGMADWLSQPTPVDAWKIRPEALFDTGSNPSPDCDAWLGQQLVLFDDRGITLKGRHKGDGQYGSGPLPARTAVDGPKGH